MMKKFLRIVCVSIIALLEVFKASSATIDVTVGYLTYTIDNSSMTAVLTGTDISNLINFTIPSSIEYAGQNYSVVEIGNRAFYACSGLKGSLTIPESVTSIGDYAFAGCSGLTGSLKIPGSVTSIGDNAFSDCWGFTGSLMIPGSVTSIGEGTFACCSGFTGSLTIPESVTSIGDSAFSGCWGFTGSLTIPESVTSIGDSVFSTCWGFTGSLTIPGSVTSIGNYAFSGCIGLTGSLTIPESVISIGDYAFETCGFTGSLTIPGSVTSIGTHAFSGCSGFTGSLAIPKSVTSIGNDAFSGCSGFTGSLTIPGSVTSIGDHAFSRCSGFTGSLTIPKSVTSIEKGVFLSCNGFNGLLTIPSSVSKIGEAAFRFCDNFESIICLIPNAPQYYDNDFPDNIIIRVPTGSRSSYYSSDDWRKFPNIYEIGDVNRNKKTTVSDAVADANYIIGIEPVGTFDEICGDMNFDGRISLIDVTQIIDAITLYNDKDEPEGVVYKASGISNGELMVTCPNNDISGITIAGDFDVTALQFDIYAEGLRAEDLILDNSLKATHSLTVSQINDNTVRAVIFSMENATIDKNEKLLWLGINNTAEIKIKNIIAASPNALEYNLDYVIAHGEPTNVDSVDLERYDIYCRDGYLHIRGAIGRQLNVYDISGKTIYQSSIVSNDYSVSLSSGIYIVDVNSIKTKITVR